MSLPDLIWLSLAAYSLHMLEEYMLDWPAWARKVSGLRIEWSDFYVVNALVILLGLVCAHFGPTVPLLALVFPALMLINAVVHVAGVVIVRGRPFPGIFTAMAPVRSAGTRLLRARGQRRHLVGGNPMGIGRDRAGTARHPGALAHPRQADVSTVARSAIPACVRAWNKGRYAGRAVPPSFAMP